MIDIIIIMIYNSIIKLKRVMLTLAEASDCGLQRRLRLLGLRFGQSDSSLSLRMTVGQKGNNMKSTLSLNNEKQKTALTLYNNFIETLTEKQIIMFEEVLDSLFELNDEFAQKDFKQGFKLGFNVAVDSLR